MKKNNLTSKNVLIAVLILALLAAGGYALSHKIEEHFNKERTASVTQQIDSSKYQAVFLTNGQVYFGKLQDNGGDYVKLTDIYYLQNQDQNKVQPKDQNSNNQSNLTLIKLGKELHAPEDMMEISRQQVLFWENIQDNGKVAQAIKQYKTNNK